MNIKKLLAKLVKVVCICFNAQALAEGVPTYLDCGESSNVKTIATLTFEKGGGDRASNSYHSEDFYHVSVIFIGKKPTNKQVDQVLRECIASAVMLDDTLYITAHAQFRQSENAKPERDVSLNPYRKLEMIVYNPDRKVIGIRPID